jgi:hypothetical protein
MDIFMWIWMFIIDFIILVLITFKFVKDIKNVASFNTINLAYIKDVDGPNRVSKQHFQ